MRFQIKHETGDVSDVVAAFSGEYRFLSNFWPCEVVLPAEQGLPFYTCASTEHYYQAAKTLNPEWRERIALSETPNLAKKLVREEGFPQREDYNDAFKLAVMEAALRQKFSDKNPELMQQLLATNNAVLIEGNSWGDVFWGVDLAEGKGGKNHLGQLLMKIRHELLLDSEK
jgi:ribA/ribD-fused uncharacterized protein